MTTYACKPLFKRMVEIHNIDYMTFDEVYNLQWKYIYMNVYKIPNSEINSFHTNYHKFRESLRKIRDLKKI